MPLLTPCESHAFQSFLSSIDYPDSLAPEWSMYAQQIMHDIPTVQGKEALTKATKDLMSLDQTDRYSSWSSSSSSPASETATSSAHPRISQGIRLPPLGSTPQSSYTPDNYWASRPAATSLVSTNFSNSVMPARTLIPSTVSSTPTAPPPASSSSRRSKRVSNEDSVKPSASNKRRKSTPSTSSSPPIPSSSQSFFNPTLSPSPRESTLASGSDSQPPKAQLLTPSQKKANHIQSEQKRRANIRRGYEALCETVPALREAIAREEEENRSKGGGGDVRDGSRGKAKRSKKKSEDDADKVDGRAGPRSENIVLQKTIDYITDLVEDRESLLGRLQRAQSRLRPGHPALQPRVDGNGMCIQPLWEREWTGGKGDVEMDEEDGGANEVYEAEGES